ncbi:MAG: ABC transporter permease [Acidimicrobiales bacterium]
MLVQVSAFVRKELVEIVRQPRLLITLVFGPFILLVIFGNSYRQEGVRLRTLFVGPPNGAYEKAVEQYSSTLEQYVRVLGYSADQKAAERELEEGRADLVVIFPNDAMEQLNAGKQATVLVLNDKLDPVQTAAVEIAARLAVQEVNSSIIATIVTKAQLAADPVDALMNASVEASSVLNDAAARRDPDAIRKASADVGDRVADLRQSTTVVTGLVESLGSPEVTQQQRVHVERVQSTLTQIDSLLGDVRAQADNSSLVLQRAADISRSLESIRPEIDQLDNVDASVLVRPFAAVTRTVLPQPIGVTAFFAPSSIALLLQHLALSLAALTLVRDRALGLLEVLRVGPTSVFAVIVGRFIAFAVAGVAVAAALIVAVTQLLDVPNLGSPVWVWTSVVMLLTASVALGMVIALVSRTDSEVVQYAMLVLLASLFFGGFVLDLQLFNSSGRAISWVLPVTWAIKVMQQVMLRGRDPAGRDFAALALQIAVYGTAALLLFRRRLRVS